MKKRLAIMIAAAARNGVIGQGDRLPWHIPSELQYFRHRTSGHALICGHRTWQHLPRSLTTQNRKIIVLSRRYFDTPDGTYIASTPQQALDLACDHRPQFPPLVIGGATVYTLMLSHCHQAEISIIDKDYCGDVMLPQMNGWIEVGQGEVFDGDPKWRVRILRPMLDSL